MRTGEDKRLPSTEKPVEQPEEEEKEKEPPQEAPEKPRAVAAVLGNTEGRRQEFLEMLVENILKGHQLSPWSVEMLPEISSAVVVFDNPDGKGGYLEYSFWQSFPHHYFQLVKCCNSIVM